MMNKLEIRGETPNVDIVPFLKDMQDIYELAKKYKFDMNKKINFIIYDEDRAGLQQGRKFVGVFKKR